MFPTVIENPVNYCFEGQDDDEDIVLVVRAHIITNLKWIIPAILIFLLPFVLPAILTYLRFNLLSYLPETYIIAFLVINYLLVLVIVLEGFLFWYFNVNIVTSKKIVDVDFENIISKGVDIAQLEDVQEVRPIVKGTFGSLFDFGHILVQTSGPKIDIDFKDVPDPDHIADIVMDAVERYRH